MKVPQSDMPEQAVWESFFDPVGLMQTLLPDAPLEGNAAELGVGYGTFTKALLASVKGKIQAYDIEPKACSDLKERFNDFTPDRLQIHCKDVLSEGTGLTSNSLSLVTAFNLLHFGDPQRLLSHVYDILEPGRHLLIIHWRSDIETPRGPDLELRPTPETVNHWCQEAGFNLVRNPDISNSCPWHFAVIATK